MTVNNSFNAARDKVTIYSPEGEPHECVRLNARELVNYQGFTWKQKNTETEEFVEPVAEPTVEEVVEPIVEPVEEPTVEADAEPNVDHVRAPLEEIAYTITGNPDVAKYLEGFTPDALRTMADQRYGEKISHLAGKDTIIKKILGFEEEKTSAQLDD